MYFMINDVIENDSHINHSFFCITYTLFSQRFVNFAFLKNDYLCLRWSETQRERKRDGSYWDQEPKAPSGSSVLVAGAQALGQSDNAFPNELAGY